MSYSLKYRDFYQQTIDVVSSDIDSKSILGIITQKLGELFDADYCLIESKNNRIKVDWKREEGLECPLGKKQYRGRSNGKVYHFTTASSQKGIEIRFLINAQENIEYLVVILRPIKWGITDKKLLEKTRESLVSTLRIAYLKHRVETTHRYQSLFEAIGNKMRQMSDVNSILNLTLADTAQALGVDRGFIVMLKYKNPFWGSLGSQGTSQNIPDANLEIVCQWQQNHSQEKDNPVNSFANFQLQDSPLCCRAWDNVPQPLAISDRPQLQIITTEEPAIFQLQSLEAILITPLIGSYPRQENKPLVLGFCILINSQPHSWQFDEVQLAKWVAIQASTSIIQNQTIQRVQFLVEERTAQLKTSLEVQAKLSDQMRRHIEELQKLNNIKDEFIATLSDELKHPLTKIKMGIEMLKIAPSKEQCERYLQILESECTKEINLVNDLLTLQKLESKQFRINPQQINIKQVIEELVSLYREEWKDKKLNFAVDISNYEYHPFYTDPDSLQRILRELLHNAGKFSRENTTIVVNVSPTINNKEIMIDVSNIGDCISPEQQISIFDPFSRGEDVNRGSNQGTGLGLALVKSLVQYLRGTINVSSYSQANSNDYINRFTVTFPLGRNAHI